MSLYIFASDGGASSSPMARLSRNDPRMQLFMDNNLQNERKYDFFFPTELYGLITS